MARQDQLDGDVLRTGRDGLRARFSGSLALIGAIPFLVLSFFLPQEAPQEQADLTSRIKAAFDLGRAAESEGHWKEMEQIYLEALELRDQVTTDNVYGASLLGYAARRLGTRYLNEDRCSQAIQLISETLEALPSMEAGYQAALHTLHGQILVELGLPDRAAGPLDEALRLARISAESTKPQVGAYNNALIEYARLKVAAGQFEEALEIIDEGIVGGASFESKIGPTRTAANRGSFDLLRAAALTHLAFDRSGEFEDAEEAYRSCLENEHLRPLDRFEARSRLAFLYQLQAEEELDALTQDLDEGRIDPLEPWEQFVYSSVESRIRQDLSVSTRRTKLLAAFDELVRTWRIAVRPGGLGVFRFRELRMGVEQLLSLSSDWEKVDVLLLAQRISSLEVSGRECSVSDVRTLVEQSGRGCLVFVPGLDRGHVIAFDDEQFVSAPLVPCADLKWAARRYLAEIAQPPDELPDGRRRRRDARIAELGADLAGRLFPPPIRAAIEDWADVLVVGRDLLRGLPFECLPVFEGQPFGLTHAVTDLPSLAAGVGLMQRRSASDEAGFLLLSDPAPPSHVISAHPSVRPLDLPKQEYTGLERRAKNGLTVVKEKQASLSGLRDGLQKEPGLLHILAHGILDYEDEVRPRIVLASDFGHPSGLLSAYEIRTLDVPERVLLSVCRAGSGVERVGDSGSSNLGGPFLDAGAKTVVLSSSDVSLASAMALSEAIYAGLAKGHSMAVALRDARRTLVESERFADPYYWGLTYAFGLGE